MTRYIALVDRADGAVGFSFPDLPGCVAQGASFEEAYDLAVAAIAEWTAEVAADGGDAPAPSTLQALTARDDVEIALGEGAAIAFVPLIRLSGRATRANMSMDEGLLAEIDDEARRRGVTRSAWIASAAREALRRSA